MYLTILKDHHKNIYDLIHTIQDCSSVEAVQSHAEELSRSLSRLAGLIAIHLAAEDKFLYPHLAKSPHEEIRETAASFNKEMGGLADAFTNFKGSYMTPSKIKANPQKYLSDSQQIIGALVQRLEHEDQKLYPLVEE